MASAARNEIDYLGTIHGEKNDRAMVREMSRRLEALRRLDQNFSASDCKPHRDGRRKPR